MAEYKSETEDKKCIFCEIASGRMQPLGGGKFFEDDKYMAWLSPFPNTKGFSVVIPKKHFGSDVLAMPDEDLREYITVTKRIAAHMVEKLDDVGRVGLIMEGTGINHAHIKLFPFNGTGYMKSGEWRQVSSGVNTYFERYIGYIASNDGPRADDKELAAIAERLRF
jgi:histidine triad (HIT) family protein